jgi:antitoxin component of MazEF toxin-antitoxin module
MSKYNATVIKTGNSIAIRVPKQYALDAGLVPGDKVQLGLATKQKTQDQEKIQRILKNLQDIRAYHSIKNPVDWQRTVRKDRELPSR